MAAIISTDKKIRMLFIWLLVAGCWLLALPSEALAKDGCLLLVAVIP
jgi:hypothetical protein